MAKKVQSINEQNIPRADTVRHYSYADEKTLNEVCNSCDDIERDPPETIQQNNKHLRLQLKMLKKQRHTLLEALGTNQAKVTRINKSLQRLSFRNETEQVLDAVDENLELEN